MKSLSAAALVLCVSSFALADASLPTSSESVKFHGSFKHDISTGTVTGGSVSSQESDVVVFNNVTSTAVTGFTRAKTENPTYGAALTLAPNPIANGGPARKLQELYFSIFNSTTGGNTGVITGGTITFNIYDNTTPYSGSGAITNPLVGTVSAVLDYSAPADQLPAGFYLTDGLIGLNSLNILMPDNVLVTQTFAPSSTSTSTRNGYVSFAPDLVGSSGTTVYIQSSVLAAGYYNLGTSPNFVDATPGFALVVPEPTSIAALSLGGLVLRRRRA